MLHALFSFVVAALSVQQVFSHPLAKGATINDTDILQYALTLEHLENDFYRVALKQFDDKAFQDAGFPSWVRRRFQQIALHEATHVKALSDALGDQATQPCNYSFPYKDVKSFTALSQVLEGVGTSAYTGAAQSITDPAIVRVAASILSVESRQVSFVASAVNKHAGWGGAFETPISFNEGFTLAAAFITSCPSTNPPLPFQAFPTLTLDNAVPGKNATVRHGSISAKPLFIVFYSGLSKYFVPIDGNNQVEIPADLNGQVYAVASSSGTEASDVTTLAGPAILLFQRDSAGNLSPN